MALIQIDRGDTIATKDGRVLRVMSVYMNGNVLSRVDAIDDADPCPMRRPIYSAEISRVVKKAVNPEVQKAQEAEAQKVSA